MVLMTPLAPSSLSLMPQARASSGCRRPVSSNRTSRSTPLAASLLDLLPAKIPGAPSLDATLRRCRRELSPPLV